MINRQQGFTLLEVMAALAIFSMLSVLAFMIFLKLPSCINVHRKKSSSSISYSAPSPFLITISCNWSPGGIGVRTKSWCWVKKRFLPRKVAIRWPLSVKHKPYSLFTGICEIIRSTVLFVLLWMAGRINPPGRCWNMSRAFFWKVTAEKARASSLSHVTSEDSAIWGVTAPFCIT